MAPDYDVKYPEDLPSQSLRAKFEGLHQMAKQRLDRDMAIIKGKGLLALAADTLLGMEDPYEILNKSFWVRQIGAAGLHKQMLAHNKFLWARRDFYNAHVFWSWMH